jgi:alkylhydroperoxidase family enzyme
MSPCRVDEHGTLWFEERICVPRDQEIRDFILFEVHSSKFSNHLNCAQMYSELRKRFGWRQMKTDIASHVAHCDTCQQVKAQHQRPAGLLEQVEILVYRWENIDMDFITGLSKTQEGYS